MIPKNPNQTITNMDDWKEEPGLVSSFLPFQTRLFFPLFFLSFLNFFFSWKSFPTPFLKSSLTLLSLQSTLRHIELMSKWGKWSEGERKKGGERRRRGTDDANRRRSNRSLSQEKWNQNFFVIFSIAKNFYRKFFFQALGKWWVGNQNNFFPIKYNSKS